MALCLGAASSAAVGDGEGGFAICLVFGSDPLRTVSSAERACLANADEISSPAYVTLTPDPVGAVGGVVRYSGEVSLDQPGPFGYTVRVLPDHPLLDSRAELGLVTYPQAPAGMTNGDLR